MGNRRRDEAGGRGGSIPGYLVVGHAGARPSEDEDEGADELSHRGLHGAGVTELVAAADGDAAEGDVEVFVGARHGRKIKNLTLL